MTQTNGGRRFSAGRDLVWMLIAVIAFGWTVYIVVDSVRGGLSDRWLSLVIGTAIWVAAGYWLTVGAWRRTRIGHRRMISRGLRRGDRGGGLPG